MCVALTNSIYFLIGNNRISKHYSVVRMHVCVYILLRRSTDRRMVPVSYTHLDVYKRQGNYGVH